ncbi:MAG TPA: hypothetical protein VFA85_17435 [Terriglobales bacterium]|nr:hypothetical protein [Terriglobales bacterium]
MEITNGLEATLILKSRVAVAVMACGSDFELFNLENISDAARQSAKERGLAYCGLLGISKADGQILLDVQPGSIEPATLARAAAAFVLQLNAANSGDSTAWLNRLYSLPDDRPQV